MSRLPFPKTPQHTQNLPRLPLPKSKSTHRPSFEKILIGPCMILGEKITGGHYLEILRIRKQMMVGWGHTPSYLHLHKTFVKETGFLKAFYRGFFPWGLCQCLKGVPVLFVQAESYGVMVERMEWQKEQAQVLSGFLGGASQAFFATPFQKLKVMVVADPKLNALPPWQASKAVIRMYGLSALYDGIIPTMFRRSLDWGIRFAVSSEVKKAILRARNDPEGRISNVELLFCGLVGGACSAFTHPIDSVITNSQRPMERGMKRDVISVMRRMWRESGPQAFTRGFSIKVMGDAYHNAWMYSVGTIVYEAVRKSMIER